jgi:hypothetical protein
MRARAIYAEVCRPSIPPEGKPPASGRNGTRDFDGEKLSNMKPTSTTDLDAWL